MLITELSLKSKLMKTVVTTLFALLLIQLNAQNRYQYHLSVTDNQGHPVANKAVTFIEKETFEQLKFSTNAVGALDVVFDHGNIWLGTIGEMYNCLYVENYGTGNGSDHITYDLEHYERENRLLPDRRTIQFEQVQQNIKTAQYSKDVTKSTIRVLLEDGKGTIFSNIPVVLTCFGLTKQFVATTNTKGEAIFEVPINNDYEVDVDGINSLTYMDLEDKSVLRTMHVQFQKKEFTEQLINGFTVQKLPTVVKPSSSHAKVTLMILKGGSPITNEPVYVRTSKSAICYKGRTNEKGEVLFMLPIKTKYLVDFTFQHDAAVIDLSRANGIAKESQTINYLPDPRLEHIEQFIPKAKDLVDYEIESFLQTQYPDPAEDVELFLKWGNKFNASSKEAVVEIGFKVRTKAEKYTGVRQLMFVVDISGSMADGDRLEMVKNTLLELINTAEPTDQFGLVVFDDAAQIAFPMTSMSDKHKMITIVKTLQPTGGTNIYNGLELGLRELLRLKKPSAVARLILLTDGYCSVPPEQTIAKATEYVQKGLQISAIGVGVDFNQALLSQLASVGGGLMQMAGDPSQIQQVFLKELNGMISPIGHDVKLEIIYNDQIIYKQLMGYTNEIVSNGKVTVAIDQLFPSLQKMALVKFDILNSSPEIEKKPVIARMTYIDEKTKKTKTVEKSIYPEWSTATGLLDMTLDKNHKKILAIAIANQCMKKMANSFEAGNRVEAKAAAQSGIDQINRLFPQAQPVELESFIKKLEEFVFMFEQQKYEPEK